MINWNLRSNIHALLRLGHWEFLLLPSFIPIKA